MAVGIPMAIGRQLAGIVFLLYVSCFLFSSCKNKSKEILGENEYYACSMDPQVLEKHPGMCPICKMPLAKITLDKNQMRIIKLNKEQMKLANVKVDSVKMSPIGKETVLNGVLAVNQDKTEQISSRVNGRVEKLYHKIIGEDIGAGEPVYDLYSQDLYLAQEEYLIALEKSELLGGNSIASASKTKLLLWGLTEKQIAELEKTKEAKISITVFSKVAGTIAEIGVKEGDIVTEGTKIYKVADLSTLWAEAQIYSNELWLLQEGTEVEIVPDAFPEEATKGKIVFANPELQAQSKINLVRAEVKNPGGKFKVGMQAYVIHYSQEKNAIVLPVDAVIRDGKQAVVWVQNKQGGFESRKVQTGIENKYRIEITSGLNTGEKVVTSAAYLINSEYVFKMGMMPMGDMKMDNMKMDNMNTGQMDTMQMADNSSMEKISEKQIKKKMQDKKKENTGTDNASEIKSSENFYTVQITISGKKIPKSSSQFRGLKDIHEYQESGIFKYTTGKFAVMDSAIALKAYLRANGFPQAFIVVFENGKRNNISTKNSNMQHIEHQETKKDSIKM